jgi:hypothetical protein
MGIAPKGGPACPCPSHALRHRLKQVGLDVRFRAHCEARETAITGRELPDGSEPTVAIQRLPP